MALTYEQIVDSLGKPDIERALEYPPRQRGRVTPPTPRYYVGYLCGCRFEMKAMGQLYVQVGHCRTHPFVSGRSK